jgi:hypothetical protein
VASRRCAGDGLAVGREQHVRHRPRARRRQCLAAVGASCHRRSCHRLRRRGRRLRDLGHGRGWLDAGCLTGRCHGRRTNLVGTKGRSRRQNRAHQQHEHRRNRWRRCQQPARSHTARRPIAHFRLQLTSGSNSLQAPTHFRLQLTSGSNSLQAPTHFRLLADAPTLWATTCRRPEGLQRSRLLRPDAPT